jgi:hypothetical protein
MHRKGFNDLNIGFWNLPRYRFYKNPKHINTRDSQQAHSASAEILLTPPYLERYGAQTR